MNGQLSKGTDWLNMTSIQNNPSRNIPRRLILLITRHHSIFLIASLLFAGVFMAFNPFVEIAENVDYFTVEDNQDVKFYNDFKEIFGSDAFFVIAFETQDLFTAKNLRLLQKITDDLEMLEEIRDVTSLSNVDDIIGSEDYFEVGRFLKQIPATHEEFRALKDSAIHNPLYVGGLVSKDGRAAAILVETHEDTGDADYKKRVIEKTRQILAKHEARGIKFHLAGSTVTNFELSQYMNRDSAIFVPAVYVLIALTVWLFFRSIPLTIAAMLNISVCVGATRGFMGLAGLSLNNLTSIVIPLVMALSLCDTVHIFSHMKKQILDEMPDRTDAMAHVLEQVAFPCFMTTLTTAFGFMSLSVSQIPGIRELAWAAAAGMGFEFIFTFFFLPSLLLFLNPVAIYHDHKIRSGLTQVMQRLGDFVKRYSRIIVTLSVLGCTAAIWFTSQIQVKTDLIAFFKADSPIRVAMNFVESRLSGVSTFDISLRAEEEDAFQDPTNLKIIEQIQDFLKTQEGVDKTLSFVDFLKDMHESFYNEDERYFRLPDSREMVAQFLLLYDAEEIEEFVNSTFDHARISVRISEHDSLKQKRMIDTVRRYINGLDTRSLDIRITGRVINEINTVDELVRGQILSLGLAALVISVIMFFVFRSVAMAILSMLPNFFPIIITFGLMGLLGIPLDTGTVLVAAIALGIAVDDTIHLLFEYQRQRSQGMSIHHSITVATQIKGRAILSSTVILSIGFGVMILSRFVPLIHFGLLTAVIMWAALAGDLIVLPSIIYLKRK